MHLYIYSCIIYAFCIVIHQFIYMLQKYNNFFKFATQCGMSTPPT